MSDIRIAEIDGKFYVYEYDASHHQVLSVGPANPHGGGRWFANGESEKAIKYVASVYANKKSAQACARRSRA